MRYASENHICNRDTPPPSRSSLIPVATRDDLVRIVVGEHWVAACLLWQTLGAAFDALGEPGAKVTIEVDADMAACMRPAVDIVDEWMGVR